MDIGGIFIVFLNYMIKAVSADSSGRSITHKHLSPSPCTDTF